MENKILAKVGTLTVTEAEVNSMIMAFGARGQSYDNPQGRELILEQLIANKLFLLEAQKNMYEYNAEFKAQMQKVKEDMLINFAAMKTLEAVKPATDEEIKKYYEDNKEQFKNGESVNASHILVDSEEKANEILKEIKEGKISFEDAARKESSCPSKDNGGNLGEFTKGQMVPEFDKAVFEMQVGEISEPVKTQFGYHLIKLNAKNEEKILELSEIKNELTDVVNKDKQQKAYQSKLNQLKILFPVDRM
jgi:peptidyl-prolyl cis-trans isomerase C